VLGHFDGPVIQVLAIEKLDPFPVLGLFLFGWPVAGKGGQKKQREEVHCFHALWFRVWLWQDTKPEAICPG